MRKNIWQKSHIHDFKKEVQKNETTEKLPQQRVSSKNEKNNKTAHS